MGVRGELFSWRVSSANEKRTYFLNVKENRTRDLYLTIVESKKHGEEDFERHQVVVFEEDMDAFAVGMDRVLSFIRKERPRPGSRGTSTDESRKGRTDQ